MPGYADSVDDDLIMIAADDPRTIVFYRRSAVDTYAAGITVTGVLRVRMADSMLNAGGVHLPQSSARFYLQASQLGGVVPKFGDRITDADGVNYQIDQRVSQAEGTMWELTCTAEV